MDVQLVRNQQDGACRQVSFPHPDHNQRAVLAETGDHGSHRLGVDDCTENHLGPAQGLNEVKCNMVKPGRLIGG